MWNRLLTCLFIVVSLLSSCRSRKNKPVEVPVVHTPAKDSSAAPATAFSLLNGTLKEWTYFSSKIDVEFNYSDGKSMSPSASIRMYKDSLIWVSAGMFGFEGVRMLINKDSAVILNKLEKSYTVLHSGVFKDISNVPLSVSQLQNLLLARPAFALELYDLVQNNGALIKIQSIQDKFSLAHTYNQMYFTMDSTLLKDKTTPNFAEVFYSSYSVVNGHNFPAHTRIYASNGPQKYTIILRYSDMDYITEVQFPFTIPASYEKTK